MLRWKEGSRAERTLLLLIVMLAAPLAAEAQNSRFGMNSVNTAPGLSGSGSIQDAGAAGYRYQISTRNLGARSTRWVLWWHDIERYNDYRGEADAVGEAFCDDSSINAIPSGDPRILWTWSNVSSHPPGNPGPRRRYDELVEADALHGLDTLIVLQGVPRCRQEIPNVKVMPRNLSEPIFLNRNGQPDHRLEWTDAIALDHGQPLTGRINPANPFAYFVFRAVQRYGDRVRWWQVWNEVDAPNYWPGTPEEHARLVEVAYHAAKYANSGVKLVMAGLQDRPDDLNHREDAERIVNALKARSSVYRSRRYTDYFDAYALHSYVGPWAAINFLHWLHTIMGLDDKPVWLTETGVNVPPSDVDEESRASYALQLVSYLMAEGSTYGLDRFFHFSLDNAADNTGLLECVGTACNDAHRREMYFAYELANQYLRDATPLSVGMNGKPFRCEIDPLDRADRWSVEGLCNHQEVYFTSPRFDRITVLWATDGFGHTADIPASGTKALLVWQDSPLNSPQPIFAANGRYQISLPAIEHLEDPMGGLTAILLECRAGNTNCDARQSKVDLAFVVDTTGSMWDDLASVRSAATQITSAIFGETADARVAVTDFRDFPVSPYGTSADYPFHIDSDFSTDPAAVASGIQRLAIGNGLDWPESVYSGLMGAIEGLADNSGQRLSGWRTDASKFILLMGDAPPHDPEPCTPQSCRRLTLSQVVNAARAGGIQPLSAVPPTYSLSPATAAVQASNPIKIYSILIGNDSAARFYYRKLAEDTGGKLFTAANASQIVAAILEALGGIHTPPSNQAPDVSGATASVPLLWPPNHKMHEVRIFNVIDPDGDPFTLTVTRITQDEPVAGEPDGEGIGTDTALLRAERTGTGDSRVYRIEFVARDARGGESTGSVLVCVPHDQGPNTACQDDGQVHDSTLP